MYAGRVYILSECCEEVPQIHLTFFITSFVQVEVSGTNYTFLSFEQMPVSLLVNELRVNFTKGEWVTLRAFAVNAVGTSDPVSVDVIVLVSYCIGYT